MVEGIAWASSKLCEGSGGRECSGKELLEQHSQASAWILCEQRSLRNIGVLLELGGLAGLLALGYSPQEMNREPRVLLCVHIQNN